MSYQVGSACYQTQADAAAAAASAQIGSFVQHAAAAYVVDATASDAISITYSLQPVDGGTPLTIASPYTAQECRLLTADDGLVLGWLIAGIWLAAYGLLFLTRGLRGETGDNYGNA